MKIAICDDEQICINDVKKHLDIYSAEHGITFEIYAFLTSDSILNSDVNFDIAFLDIEMDGASGIEIGRALRQSNPDVVLLFITAYNHYLDNALDLGVLRFFDKPIVSERFYNGLTKAISKIDNTEIQFYLKDKNDGIVAVKMKDIILAEIAGRKIRVVTKDNEYISKDNIKTWKERLNSSYFISPHHSYIVNMNYITYLDNDFIVLDRKHRVPIAYSKRTDFKRKFVMYKED